MSLFCRASHLLYKATPLLASSVYDLLYHRSASYRFEQSSSMQESCCQGQHMYLHAQMMLTQLAQLPRGARFRRLSQELELHAAKLQGQIAWQMHFWCAHTRPTPRQASLKSILIMWSIQILTCTCGAAYALHSTKSFHSSTTQDTDRRPWCVASKRNLHAGCRRLRAQRRAEKLKQLSCSCSTPQILRGASALPTARGVRWQVPVLAQARRLVRPCCD